MLPLTLSKKWNLFDTHFLIWSVFLNMTDNLIWFFLVAQLLNHGGCLQIAKFIKQYAVYLHLIRQPWEMTISNLAQAHWCQHVLLKELTLGGTESEVIYFGCVLFNLQRGFELFLDQKVWPIGASGSETILARCDILKIFTQNIISTYKVAFRYASRVNLFKGQTTLYSIDSFIT